MSDELRRHNPDWLERQKPCALCGEPIGDAAMVTGVQVRYHAQCLKEEAEKESNKTQCTPRP